MRPTVSVIMPARNTARWIGDAISSVRSQTFSDWELLVVDDASTDSTESEVRKAAEESFGSRIHLTVLPSHSGAAAARNHAITRARGLWLAFLDSDDCWHPRKLETMLDFADHHGSAFVFHAFEVIDRDGLALGLRRPAPSSVKYDDLLRLCPINCSTAMYNTEKVGKLLMPNFRLRQDLAYWLKVLRRTEIAFGLDETLAFYRIRPDSLSRNKLRAAYYQWQVYCSRNGVGLSYWKAAFAFVRYCHAHLVHGGYVASLRGSQEVRQ